MSPKTKPSERATTPTSPWTDCFQSSPVHSQGTYTSPPTDSEQQNPTTDALNQIFNLTHRS